MAAVSDCIIWSKCRFRAGYGRAWNKGKIRLAHRVAWETVFGDIPAGLCVLHRCDNRSCVNPEHLFLGTQRENIADMDAKGRRGSASGERHGMAKLTLEDVACIKELSATGLTGTAIAKKFGVSRSTVSLIMRGKIWVKQAKLANMVGLLSSFQQ